MTPAESAVPAIYYDGKTNTKRSVVVYLGTALNITEDRRLTASWPLVEVRRHDVGDGVMRLGLTTNPLSRLVRSSMAMAASARSQMFKS